MTIQELVAAGRQNGCSDIHLTVGAPVPCALRRDGALFPAPFSLDSGEAEALIRALAEGERPEGLCRGEDMDFAFALPQGRQRVNIFWQQGHPAAAIRLLSDHIPTLEELSLPPVLGQLADSPRGLILVTGPTGSGKSTTLAAMIQRINRSRPAHILTVEDPVEYLYTPELATVHQREVGRDVPSFAAALRSALREDPDVILVGEMRDYETISAAVTAAETGHLVLSTLHTTGAAQTIDRIVDVCPPQAQSQMRSQLSAILRGVITQQLLPRVGGGRIAATEVLVGTDAVLNLIRENKCHQLDTPMQAGAAQGMHTLNADLANLARRGVIDRQTALQASTSPANLREYL
ncbi:type IV pilus twitching motility protein PilT [Bittarella massiliensis (ex Durand et al. 2017)]|uniref:Type IV pilus twitching motility protein PilT n=1 Tax=Bittarella massiliensis (ex Durand et al. 2017) TaxID=1720313 RepID=A0AAW5KDZ4_9FIRM|nr:type IV pilus twitching motility protein PilT [Bittarella massiliensis (ex Durand et al. 2017)]MCQ4949561.1 type IV pilus twitching motility protein PilT [Bittarella massiliensis (ex Durand et al. 2017)]